MYGFARNYQLFSRVTVSHLRQLSFACAQGDCVRSQFLELNHAMWVGSTGETQQSGQVQGERVVVLYSTESASTLNVGLKDVQEMESESRFP